ncbi:MAG: SURF1 family protein [Chloroflexi bacterium]|nr:SURF1 family protein [Chloroflexota bacterium]
MSMLRTMLGPGWRWVTLFVVILFGVFIRLGIWQIDRNAQRIASDKRITDSLSAPPVALTPELQSGDLIKLEYRAVMVSGMYDHANQIGWRNQVWNENAIGIRLLTPLVISGTRQAVLIDRGWVPLNEAAPDNWKKFDEPGVVQVSGIIRISQSQTQAGSTPNASTPFKLWDTLILTQIGAQMPYPILPVYIQQSPDRAAPKPVPGIQPALPIRTAPELALSDGSNIAYATQWFLFAIITVAGYPYFIRYQERKRQHSEQIQP